MGYFRGVYNYLSRRTEIFSEAFEKGLEFRAAYRFFYNPVAGTYDDMLRGRLLREEENREKEIAELIKDGNFSLRRYKRESFLAQILFSILHPKKVAREGMMKS